MGAAARATKNGCVVIMTALSCCCDMPVFFSNVLGGMMNFLRTLTALAHILWILAFGDVRKLGLEEAEEK